MSQNPDFARFADDVIVPPEPLFGWGEENKTLSEQVLIERVGQDKLAKDMPVAIRIGNPEEILPEIATKWATFQKSKGRGEGSCDWSLLDEFVLGTQLYWLPQIIGSCVVSNSFRGWVIRLMYQIGVLGLPMEYLGRSEFGPKNYSFYGPFSYGAARKRVNMRGGDGLYCEALQQSFLKDGVIMCNTPELQPILTSLNVAGDKDFPEPQRESVYRRFGDWQYIEQLRPYADFVLEDCPIINSEEELRQALQSCRPCFFCSGIAIRKIGTHPDGFTIHGRDPNNSWAHNMCFHGFFFASDGELFYVFSNESWGRQHLYIIRQKEVDGWFKSRNVTSAAIGMIRGPKSSPPLLEI
jgi:hypothetical protein